MAVGRVPDPELVDTIWRVSPLRDNALEVVLANLIGTAQSRRDRNAEPAGFADARERCALGSPSVSSADSPGDRGPRA